MLMGSHVVCEKDSEMRSTVFKIEAFTEPVKVCCISVQVLILGSAIDAVMQSFWIALASINSCFHSK